MARAGVPAGLAVAAAMTGPVIAAAAVVIGTIVPAAAVATSMRRFGTCSPSHDTAARRDDE